MSDFACLPASVHPPQLSTASRVTHHSKTGSGLLSDCYSPTAGGGGDRPGGDAALLNPFADMFSSPEAAVEDRAAGR
jgi:hypothetical protein